jgi:hypothetical protein
LFIRTRWITTTAMISATVPNATMLSCI